MLNSAFAYAYFARAMAFEKRGDPSAANRDYAQAQTLDPKLERRTAVAAGTGTGTGSSTLPVAGSAGGVYRPGAGVVLPRVVREVRPQYTAAALEAKIQGIVLLECVVGANGVVNDVRVVRSLDTAAVSTMRRSGREAMDIQAVPRTAGVPVFDPIELHSDCAGQGHGAPVA